MCNKCKLIRVKFESMLNKKKNKCLFVCIVRTSIFSAKYRDTPSFQLHLSPHLSFSVYTGFRDPFSLYCPIWPAC